MLLDKNISIRDTCIVLELPIVSRLNTTSDLSLEPFSNPNKEFLFQGIALIIPVEDIGFQLDRSLTASEQYMRVSNAVTAYWTYVGQTENYFNWSEMCINSDKIQFISLESYKGKCSNFCFEKVSGLEMHRDPARGKC